MIKISLDEKLRPSSMKNLVLLDRVKAVLPEPLELSQNLMLYSVSPGLGKSSYCNLFLKTHDCLRINSSLEGKIDVVRDEIEKFCLTQSFKFNDRKKVVIFEEADSLSRNVFMALQPLIESYHNNVIFICNLNKINKVPESFRSRFLPINFEPITDLEEQELIKKLKKYLTAVCKRFSEDTVFENNTVLETFIKNNFPSIRNMLKQLQSFIESGTKTITLDILNTTNGNENLGKYVKLFDLILDKNADSVKTYQTIIGNYSNRMNELLSILSTGFIDWQMKPINQTL